MVKQKSEKTIKTIKNIDSSDSTDNTKNEAKILEKINSALRQNQYSFKDSIINIIIY